MLFPGFPFPDTLFLDTLLLDPPFLIAPFPDAALAGFPFSVLSLRVLALPVPVRAEAWSAPAGYGL